MLVGERMSHPVFFTAPDTPINDALNRMRAEHIRRLPVIKDGKLVGIVTDTDLLNASPSPVTSLSIWEMNYLLSKVTVKDVMTKEVLTVSEDTPIEMAARILADNKIGGLPVMRDDRVVGILTETDLFKIFLELMGAREQGVRVSFLAMNKPGELLKLSQAVFGLCGNIIALGTFAGEDPSTLSVTIKVAGVEPEKLRQAIQPLVLKINDLRVC
jgi:acetoin utilization protein AcuB